MLPGFTPGIVKIPFWYTVRSQLAASPPFKDLLQLDNPVAFSNDNDTELKTSHAFGPQVLQILDLCQLVDQITDALHEVLGVCSRIILPSNMNAQHVSAL